MVERLAMATSSSPHGSPTHASSVNMPTGHENVPVPTQTTAQRPRAPPAPSAQSRRQTVIRVKRKRSEAPLDSLLLEMPQSKRAMLESLSASLSMLSATGASSVRGASVTPTPSPVDPSPLEVKASSAELARSTRAAIASVLGSAKAGAAPVRERRHFRRVATVESGAGVGEWSRPGSKQAATHKEKAHARSAQAVRDRKAAGNRVARFREIQQHRMAAPGADGELLHLVDIALLHDEEPPAAAAAAAAAAAGAANEAAGGLGASLGGSADKSSDIMCNYLPLVREFVSEAAAREIEGDDEYVWDVFYLNDDGEGAGAGAGAGSDAYDALVVRSIDDNWTLDDLVFDTDEAADALVGMGDDSDDSERDDNPRFDYPDEDSDGAGMLSSEDDSWDHRPDDMHRGYFASVAYDAELDDESYDESYYAY